MDIVLLVGRLLFGAIFIYSGIAHITKTQDLTGYATYKNIPAAKIAVILSGLMILIGGLYITFGVYADLGALLIAIFLIPTAFLMHAFWKESETMTQQSEKTHFLKDVSLSGAALIIFALVSTGSEFGPSITSAFFNF